MAKAKQALITRWYAHHSQILISLPSKGWQRDGISKQTAQSPLISTLRLLVNSSLRNIKRFLVFWHAAQISNLTTRKVTVEKVVITTKTQILDIYRPI